MDVALKAIADYGIELVALVAVSLFAWWAIRGWIRGLEQRGERSLDISERQVAATEELARIVHAALDELARERRR